MKILLTMKYLTLPVNTNTASKKVLIYENGELLFDFDCKIDMIDPNFTAYLDVSRFAGKTVDIKVSPEMNFEVGLADAENLPDLYHEPLRPQIHFTVKNGFNNDPNGLIKHGDTYHLFFQFNPCSTEWGNMHWGHAVSRDLFHWTQLDPALFPDDTGTMYSGSAIEDKNNVSGLGKNAMLLYYTAAGDRNRISKNKTRTQCLAYSNDGGVTFTKYENNPVVGNIESYNRDPKVVYVEELGKYVMMLYLVDIRYQMLTSSDLINWEPLQEIELRTDAECPDIYPLYLDGEKLWIISGASDVYVVGRFKGGAFVIENSEKKLSYSTMGYAAQSYTGLENDRIVRITWNRLKMPGSRFSQQMSVPAEMHLESVQQRYYLAALPADEIKALYSDTVITDTDFTLEKKHIYEVGENPLDIKLSAPYIPDGKITLKVFGTNIVCDTSLNQITTKDVKMPISILGDRIELRVIIDRCSAELFADNGKFIGTSSMICDYNLPRIELTATLNMKIDRFECHILNSIYNKNN